jgi:hypothetical protein
MATCHPYQVGSIFLSQFILLNRRVLATLINSTYNMASDGNAFEILPDPQLEDLTTPGVTTFLETRRRYDRMIDDKNASLAPSKRIPKTPLKTVITPHVLAVICSHHVRVSEDNLTDEALLASRSITR